MKAALCVPLLLLSIIAIGYCGVEDDDMDLERGSKDLYARRGAKCKSACVKKDDGKYQCPTFKWHNGYKNIYKSYDYCSTGPKMGYKGRPCETDCYVQKYRKWGRNYDYTRCNLTSLDTYAYCSLTKKWKGKTYKAKFVRSQG